MPCLLLSPKKNRRPPGPLRLAARPWSVAPSGAAQIRSSILASVYLRSLRFDRPSPGPHANLRRSGCRPSDHSRAVVLAADGASGSGPRPGCPPHPKYPVAHSYLARGYAVRGGIPRSAAYRDALKLNPNLTVAKEELPPCPARSRTRPRSRSASRRCVPRWKRTRGTPLCARHSRAPSWPTAMWRGRNPTSRPCSIQPRTTSGRISRWRGSGRSRARARRLRPPCAAPCGSPENLEQFLAGRIGWSGASAVRTVSPPRDGAAREPQLPDLSSGVNLYRRGRLPDAHRMADELSQAFPKSAGDRGPQGVVCCSRQGLQAAGIPSPGRRAPGPIWLARTGGSPRR